MTGAPSYRWRPDNRLIVGLNYSGMHDSAVAVVTQPGEVRSACALERISRVKQDGRWPRSLLESVPWNEVETVAISTDEYPWSPVHPESKLHPRPLPSARPDFLAHGEPFYDFLARVPKPKRFVCHQLSHAASAFWPSGFNEALCLTYDGGMCNSPWFGGLFRADRTAGLEPLDRFASSHYAKITTLYTVVTALLGLTPNKHEGKITGLAARGCPDERCREILEDLLVSDFRQAEAIMEWLHVYSDEDPPLLWVDPTRAARVRVRFDGIAPEDIASTVQAMSEEHVIEILRRARDYGWNSDSICLSGGLFANVKINQRIRELGFQRIFVSPPMTDDGTALGAALSVASQSPLFDPPPATDVFWGPAFPAHDNRRALEKAGLSYTVVPDPEQRIASVLKAGAAVGVYQGQMEFGPRALGNRSILSAATDPDITHRLNVRLHRTEFMPFAPVTRAEDTADCYTGLPGAERCAEFMTIASGCTPKMREETPGAVHVDGTARPQIVRSETHPLIHRILTEYKAATGISSLINTSFNIHEEPIVCRPAEAIQAFLEGGLDMLYLEGGFLVSLEDNLSPALPRIRHRLQARTRKELELASVVSLLSTRAESLSSELDARIKLIEELTGDLSARAQLIGHLHSEAEARADMIKRLVIELDERAKIIHSLVRREGIMGRLRRCLGRMAF